MLLLWLLTLFGLSGMQPESLPPHRLRTLPEAVWEGVALTDAERLRDSEALAS